MSLPYHKVDWELVAEVRRTQGRVTELEKQVRELQRLVSKSLAEDPTTALVGTKTAEQQVKS